MIFQPRETRRERRQLSGSARRGTDILNPERNGNEGIQRRVAQVALREVIRPQITLWDESSPRNRAP